MDNMQLVIGGNGFVGYNVLKKLVEDGRHIRCIDKFLPEKEVRFDNVEYRIGDVMDKDFLMESLSGVDTVLDFISTTMPNTQIISLENEISRTLKYHDYILLTMATAGVKKYVFPSSGGAIYGSRTNTAAVESDILCPSTPYGAGKKMAEDMIHYYHQKCGLNAIILRIGNVYGSTRFRARPQGVIDVFVQNALESKPIAIWGNAEAAVRDYVYLEDVGEAISLILDKDIDGVQTYNVGTGVGTSVLEVIKAIEQNLGHELTVIRKEDRSSGINQIVLSIDKIANAIGWAPKVSLEEGIQRTIKN